MKLRIMPAMVAALTALVGPLSMVAPVSAAGYNQAALQQDVNAVQAVGTSSAIAEVDGADGTSMKARAGLAQIGSSQPAPLNGHFRMGSATKTFISSVILQLESEGKLSLNDTVEHWLPGMVQGKNNDGNTITIRNLLQHTSGLYDYLSDKSFDATFASPDGFYANHLNHYTPEQLVSIAMSHSANFQPGTRFEYSNTNYVLAGLIIKAVTGETWDVQVKKRIITPLGLNQTTAPGTDPTMPTPYAHAYELFDTNRTYTDVTVDEMSWGDAAGALITTTSDLNHFIRALVSGQVLPPTQLAEMQTTVPTTGDIAAVWPGSGYGLGLIKINLPCGGFYWSHGGDTLGYSTRDGVTPDGKRSVVVSSATNTEVDTTYANDNFRTTNAVIEHALCNSSSASSAASPASAGVSIQ